MTTNEALPVTAADVEAAARMLEGQVIRTPTLRAASLSSATGSDLTLKLETLQATGSFKARGAYVRMARLEPSQRERGVIAMSAGNHAQGVALHARRLGIPATIVMPEPTPFTKIEATARHGAEVVLSGTTLAECRERTEELMQQRGLTLIHPYDDPDIIAGQGTVGLEMLADAPDLDLLVVPIGGGGLISGVAVAARRLAPRIEIVGVEAALYPSMYQALNDLPATSGGETLAEGIAVKTPGTLTRRIVEALVDDIVLVGEPALERSVLALLEQEHVLAEGAGAAGFAAVLERPERFRDRKVGIVIGGGNIDTRLLASVMMRGMVRDGRLVRLRIEIADVPGMLARVADVIGRFGGNIVEIYHQRLFHDVPAKRADLDVVIETRNAEHVRTITSGLSAAGLRWRLLGTSATAGEIL